MGWVVSHTVFLSPSQMGRPGKVLAGRNPVFVMMDELYSVSLYIRGARNWLNIMLSEQTDSRQQ